MNDSEMEQHIAAVLRLNDGVQRMTLETFSKVLEKTLGSDSIYCQRAYQNFQDNPLAYLATRSPLKQSEELLRVMK